MEAQSGAEFLLSHHTYEVSTEKLQKKKTSEKRRKLFRYSNHKPQAAVAKVFEVAIRETGISEISIHALGE